MLIEKNSSHTIIVYSKCCFVKSNSQKNTKFIEKYLKGRYLHPSENRAINMLEALILQGFPVTYKFPSQLGIGKISSMIGEAFPPPMAKAQGEAIIKLLHR